MCVWGGFLELIYSIIHRSHQHPLLFWHFRRFRHSRSRSLERYVGKAQQLAHQPVVVHRVLPHWVLGAKRRHRRHCSPRAGRNGPKSYMVVWLGGPFPLTETEARYGRMLRIFVARSESFPGPAVVSKLVESERMRSSTTESLKSSRLQRRPFATSLFILLTMRAYRFLQELSDRPLNEAEIFIHLEP